MSIATEVVRLTPRKTTPDELLLLKEIAARPQAEPAKWDPTSYEWCMAHKDEWLSLLRERNPWKTDEELIEQETKRLVHDLF
ncbi:MAG: hypothetical protein LUG14_14790 [Synergistaceae bacterium]|nr:hypothetical protein [Synergistaceae bacterium]